jgi:head-tail adaptor
MATSLKAGTLDRRITFYEQRSTKDEFGGFVSRLYPIATVWAAVASMAGRLLDGESQQRTAEADTRITARHRGDITQRTIAAYKGEAYDLLNVAEIGRREGLDLLARRTNPQPALPDVLRRFPDGLPLTMFSGASLLSFAGSALRSFEEDTTGGDSEVIATFSDAELLTA